VVLASFTGTKKDARLVEGCMLAFINDEKVSSRNADEVASFLASYSGSDDGTPLRLTFDVARVIDPTVLLREGDELVNKEFDHQSDDDPDAALVQPPHAQAEDSTGIIRIIRSKIDLPLPTQLLVRA
jgi:hypothetical protein